MGRSALTGDQHTPRPRHEGLSGQLGVVIEFDAQTNAKAVTLAALLPVSSLVFRVTSPHLSLYQAFLREVPEDAARSVLSSVASTCQQPLTFEAIGLYGDHFVFWDATRTEELQMAHRVALRLARFVDREATAAAINQGLRLSEEERKNVSNVGYPLAGNLFRPHITLGYSPTPLLPLPEASAKHRWTARVVDAALVSVGEHGAVAEVLLTASGCERERPTWQQG